MGMIKKVKQSCELKKVFLKPYDYICNHKQQVYHVKMIKFFGDAIVTFNSKFHLSIKTGKVKDGRFITKKETIIQLDEFSSVDQKVIVFDKTPFNVLKQLNESDIEEIENNCVYDYILISKEEDLLALKE
jgi:hypothetical protein